MSESLYRKIEGILYSYYRKRNRISNLRIRLLKIQDRIEKLRRDLRECNLELGETLKAIDYSGDPIKCSSVTSNIEKALEKAIDKILQEIEMNIRSKYKIKNKIISLEKQIEDIDIVLDKLTEEELQIVELKYGSDKNFREMEKLLHMGKSTLQRKKDRIVDFLINEMGQKWDKVGTK